MPSRGLFAALLFALVAASTMAAAQNAAPQSSADPSLSADRQRLAPTGTLRIGVYPGSPTSLLRDATTGEERGIAVDLGRSLAGQNGIRAELVVLKRLSDVIDAMKVGTVDFTVTNASPARAAEVDFSQTLLSIELGYLVRGDSPARLAQEMSAPGLRIGVTKGSTSEATLPRLLPQARIVPAANLDEAIALLQRQEIDAYATNKPTLFEMADRMGGGRVLEGRWGEEHMAAAIPKGRDGALTILQRFATDARTSGAVIRAARRAGLRGMIEDSGAAR